MWCTRMLVVCVYVLCDTLGRHEQISPHPRFGVCTHQSKDTVKVQVGEPNSFIWVTHSSMGEGLFTGEGMTQRQLQHQSPHWHGRSQKLENLEHTEKSASSSDWCRTSFIGALTGLNLFWTA